MNKYRISIMCVLLIMVFLYMQGVIEITVVTNFAFTCTSLLFSISSVIEIFLLRGIEQKSGLDL